MTRSEARRSLRDRAKNGEKYAQAIVDMLESAHNALGLPIDPTQTWGDICQAIYELKQENERLKNGFINKFRRGFKKSSQVMP